MALRLLSKEGLARFWANWRFPLSTTGTVLSLIIGIVGGSIGLLDSFRANDSVREWVLSTALAVLAIGAILCFFVRERKTSEALRLLRVLNQIEDASRILRDVRIFLRNKKDGTGGTLTENDLVIARNKIRDVLTIYANILSNLTSSRCRTCIKMLEVGSSQGEDEIYVFTLTRDLFSSQENARHDKIRQEQKLDKLKENTDFNRLWDVNIDDPGFFISGNLREEEGYNTSSLKYWRTIEGNPNQNVMRPWPLPYLSAIVWPIRQDPAEELGLATSTTIGFLAVDSRLANAFNRDVHAPIGKILANSLFPLLRLYVDLAGMLSTPQRKEASCPLPEGAPLAPTP